MAAPVRGVCRHCLRWEVVRRGICLKCRAVTSSTEELILKINELQTQLEKERHLKRLLEFQLRTAKNKLIRAKKKI